MFALFSSAGNFGLQVVGLSPCGQSVISLPRISTHLLFSEPPLHHWHWLLTDKHFSQSGCSQLWYLKLWWCFTPFACKSWCLEHSMFLTATAKSNNKVICSPLISLNLAESQSIISLAELLSFVFSLEKKLFCFSTSFSAKQLTLSNQHRQRWQNLRLRKAQFLMFR